MTTQSFEDEVQDLLRARREGDRTASGRLFELLYQELRGMAQRRMSVERLGHTLAPTSLVHEVYLRLQGAEVHCADRDEFLKLAATVMRRVLVDSARRRRTRQDRALARHADSVQAPVPHDAFSLRLEDALSQLGERDAQLLRIVELRFLVGLTVEEITGVLEISSAKVKRDWRIARAFLQSKIADHDED